MAQGSAFAPAPGSPGLIVAQQAQRRHQQTPQLDIGEFRQEHDFGQGKDIDAADQKGLFPVQIAFQRPIEVQAHGAVQKQPAEPQIKLNAGGGAQDGRIGGHQQRAQPPGGLRRLPQIREKPVSLQQAPGHGHGILLVDVIAHQQDFACGDGTQGRQDQV